MKPGLELEWADNQDKKLECYVSTLIVSSFQLTSEGEQ